jgi:methionine-rich copper-binding protein CopC
MGNGKMKSLGRVSLCVLIFLGMWASIAGGHAFPDHSKPKVGEALAAPPPEVRIWFDGALEPAFCTLRVQDMSGRQVDKGDGHVDDSDPTLIEVSLLPLSSGTYKVIWSVFSRDGHRTQGDYTFRVK